jgi:hypothetical protein
LSDSKLIAEAPRLILPSLAVAVGLNEAIVLQQVHFLTCNGGGEPTARDLAFAFPFWNPRTIERALGGLVGEDLVEAGGPRGRERSRWYRVGYAELGRRVNLSDKLPDKLTLSQRQSVVVPLLNAVREGKREDAPAPKKYSNVIRRPGA